MIAVHPLVAIRVSRVAHDKVLMHRRLRAAVRFLHDSLPERIR